VLGAKARGSAIGGGGAIASRIRQLATRFRGGSVSPLLAADDPTRRRVAQATARADSIRLLLAMPSGTVGRFRRDSTLAAQITAVRAEVTAVRALLDEPTGAAGRVLHDGVLARQLAELEAELGVLAADVRDRPLRYIVF
jgi:hypothetical protein